MISGREETSGLHGGDGFRLVHVDRVAGAVEAAGDLVHERQRHRDLAAHYGTGPFRGEASIVRARHVGRAAYAARFRVEKYLAFAVAYELQGGPAPRIRE